MIIYVLCAVGGILLGGVVCGLICFNPLINVLLKAVVCSTITNALFVLVFRRSDEFDYLRQIAGKVLGMLRRIVPH